MKILIVNKFGDRFTYEYKDKLKQKGHSVDVAVREKTTKLANLQAYDLVVSCWADDVLMHITHNLRTKRLITFLRSYEAFTPEFITKINWAAVDGMVFVADHVRDLVHEDYKRLQLDKIPNTIIYNGVDIDKVKPTPLPDRLVIGYSGYLNHKKGIQILFQNCRNISGA
jgi:glycosyltransferase involved in cell wall biosynthesis